MVKIGRPMNRMAGLVANILQRFYEAHRVAETWGTPSVSCPVFDALRHRGFRAAGRELTQRMRAVGYPELSRAEKILALVASLGFVGMTWVQEMTSLLVKVKANSMFWSVSRYLLAKGRRIMNQHEPKLIHLDPTRPFLEVIKERAEHFHPYPQRLVEQFESIPRALFVPEALKERFLDRVHTDDGCAGLLSQPSLIFDMIAFLFLKGKERIFEGGTGTGYQTAILANLCQHVYTVERNRKRLEASKERLATLGISNVTFVHGDAADGLPQYAPFDRMIFGAAIHGEVEQHLLDQMASLCRLIVPTGTYDPKMGRVMGDFLQVDKRDGQVTQKINPICNGTLFFVPLVSPHGMGWTLVNGDYVPSTLAQQKPRRFSDRVPKWLPFAKKL
jgi:protein-L-isoaspartate(D-aspartate) O-methyltransferase